MFDFIPTRFPGCFQISVNKRFDNRGFFVKTFHRAFFEQKKLNIDFREQYYSSSNEGCLRGMHFQTPPHDHGKLVYCISGTVLDVVVDLRRGSPTYGQAEGVALSGESGSMLYIPQGLAHGFYVLSGPSIMVYNVTTEYAPNHDVGILWSSIPFKWPNAFPVISSRDSGFPAMDDFETPFTFTPPGA
jgi:dTDP-4-dehydrorhamnose 3,5-epimerase